MGQHMTPYSAVTRRPSIRATRGFLLASALLLAPGVFSSAANAQALGYASTPQDSFPSDNVMTTDRKSVV